MKKISLLGTGLMLVFGFSTALIAEDNVCVKYSKKMQECMVKEFGKTCEKHPNCSMCMSVHPNEEMKKSMEEGYASMQCEGDFKKTAEKNVKLSCAKDKYVQDSLKSMKQGMKSMAECK